MRLLAIVFAAISLLASPVFAIDLQELRDTIDDIESKIDDIDLDQSKDDIQSELDDIKQALEDLKGDQVIYQAPHPKGSNYRFVPINPLPRGCDVETGTAVGTEGVTRATSNANRPDSRYVIGSPRWIEQQKANLRSPNPIVRQQARANLGIK